MRNPANFKARDLEAILNVLFTSILLVRDGNNLLSTEDVAERATAHAKRIADDYKDVIEGNE